METIIGKGNRGKYIDLFMKDYPGLDSRGRISEHRYVMEKYLGRKLERNEYIHHKNENTKDNRLKNLELVSPQKHREIHSKKSYVNVICEFCGKTFERIKSQLRNNHNFCNRRCMGLWAKNNGNLLNGSEKKPLEEKYITTVVLKCPECKKIFERDKKNTHLTTKTRKYTSCSRKCSGSLSRKIQLQKFDINLIKDNVVRIYKKYGA